MEEVQPLQVFIRNDKGKVWGPLTPASVELLFDNGVIEGRVQLSLDGSNYMFPGRMPNVRTFVPRALWGDVVVPGDDLEHPPPPPPMPGNAPASAAAAMAGQGTGGVRAGPGAVANAVARTHAAMAGPGARAQMDKRFAPNLGTPVLKPAAPAAPAAPVAAAPPPPPPPPAAPAPAPAHPPMPVISDGKIPSNGDLSQTSALHLYYLIGTSDSTGLLTLATSDRQIDIHFRKGNPEFVDSNHADDLLTSFLVRAHLATFEQLASADAQKIRFGGELIGALFGLGILNPATAVTHLTTRASSILFRAFLADSGVFHFEPIDLPVAKAMPLGNRWSVLAEQARKVPPIEIRRRMAALVDNPVMKSGGRLASDQLRLTPQEARALSYFDGVHSLAQLEAAHPAEADVILRVAWMLKDLEAVSFAGVKLAAPAPVVEAEPLLEATVVEATVIEATVIEAEVEPEPAPVVAPPPQPSPAAAPKPAAAVAPPKVAAAGPPRPVGSPGARPPPPTLKPGGAAAPPPAAPRPAAPPPPAAAAPKPAAPAAPAANLEGEVRALEQTLKTMREQNFFEMFGLTPKAEAGQIKIAYFKLAKVYHPDTIPPGAPEAYAKTKADIFARIGEANRTLTDEKARIDYIADLEAGGTGGDKIDVAQILAAEELFSKGMIFVKARKYPEAVKLLEDAIKSNPEEGEFYAWRGYAKFCASADKNAGTPEALKDIAICTKKNPRVANAYYFQGLIAKRNGDLAIAKQMFQKTVELQRDHIDAQRELRLMK